MAQGNYVEFTGNLTREFGLHNGEGKQAFGTFGIAVNKRIKKGDEWVDSPPLFMDVKVFGDLASNCAESLEKGDRVTVRGELEPHGSYTKDGVEHTSKTASMVAEEVAVSLAFGKLVEFEKNAPKSGRS